VAQVVAYVMIYNDIGTGGGARLESLASSEFMCGWSLSIITWLEDTMFAVPVSDFVSLV